MQKEIQFVLEREQLTHPLVDLQEAGKLPLRVTHNDTKLNNIMIDNATHKGICVIDLDTVMPGQSCVLCEIELPATQRARLEELGLLKMDFPSFLYR